MSEGRRSQLAVVLGLLSYILLAGAFDVEWLTALVIAVIAAAAAWIATKPRAKRTDE